jgi:hypothetical protein
MNCVCVFKGCVFVVGAHPSRALSAPPHRARVGMCVCVLVCAALFMCVIKCVRVCACVCSAPPRCLCV